jgi:hypothetical protein
LVIKNLLHFNILGDLYVKHAVENLQSTNVPSVVAENPLDKLNFQSKEFAEGITNVAKLLNITPHPDPLITLKAVAKMVTTRLSPQAQANPSEVIIKVILCHLSVL